MQAFTEDEERAYEIQREWRDKISKKLGGYMLKGYCMLASHCDKCQTVMLRDRSKKEICIGCTEYPLQQHLDELNATAAALEASTNNTKQADDDDVSITTPVNSRPSAMDECESDAQSDGKQTSGSSKTTSEPTAKPAFFAVANDAKRFKQDTHGSLSTDASEQPQTASTAMQVQYATHMAAQALATKCTLASDLLSRAPGAPETLELIQVIQACVSVLQQLKPMLD